MPSYLQIESISKAYGPKVLFEHIGFNVNEGDKIALIAPNGTGKTSLLRILAGEDKSDSGGRILFLDGSALLRLHHLLLPSHHLVEGGLPLPLVHRPPFGCVLAGV